jgi:hypothetical protein
VRAWHAMRPAAQPLAQQARTWWIEGYITTFTARWDFGTKVNAVRADPGRFGTDSPRQLAEFFRAYVDRLEDDALVAREFDRERVIELARRETRSGPHISWRHLVLLANIPAGADRERLIELTFNQALTVSELRNEITRSTATDKKAQEHVKA